MPNAFINLLPGERTRALRQEYFFRLATVAAVVLTLIVVAYGALLAPTYFYLLAQVQASQNQLNQLNASSANDQERQIQARLTTLNKDAQYLTSLAAVSTGSAAIRSILVADHSGVLLTGFTFTPPANASSTAKMNVTGVAKTREDLRTYDLTLSSLPFIKSADLPISAYAQESNIPFTITLSGTFVP